MADIYSQQLQSGDDYHLLQPTYSIWLLNDNVVADDQDYLHEYKLRDANGHCLIEHGGIWLLELEKFNDRKVRNEEERWLLFFKEGGHLSETNLPDWMTTPEMTQAMKTLRQFSEKDRNYHAYQARQNFLREQRTIQMELETALAERNEALAEKMEALAERNEALAEKTEALAERNEALAEKMEALAEIARLKELLEESGKPH